MRMPPPSVVFFAMKSAEATRAEFLSFFEEKGHTVVPSASLVPVDDPTLLFTNAGMNQFKDVFLETGSRDFLRAVDTQKCLRVSGKHNDLDEVGIDTYHHTLFEMLGNWSFGDYFKKEAIAWAWELLVDRWGLSPDRLYATVHEGDEGLNLGPDDEAAAFWRSETGIPPAHIFYCPSKDNFWMMGETGPCGPCSEIHVDLRSDEERAATPGGDLVNADHPEVVEIWNLVFIQYNALENGSLKPLSAKHVDTGMGLERMVAALQGVSSTYDTDLFAELLQAVADLTPQENVRGYNDIVDVGDDERELTRVAMRVIADHIRAVAFAIADGVVPGNEGRGYVIRRILRRAIRYGYQTLAIREPFLNQLLMPLRQKMGGYFHELEDRAELIEQVVVAEEEGFLRTLEAGIGLFETQATYVNQLRAGLSTDEVGQRLRQDRSAMDLVAKAYPELAGEEAATAFLAEASGGVCPGAVAFLLHDTYGFPVDLTEVMAREKGLTVNTEAYEARMHEQRERARSASDFAVRTGADAGDWIALSEGTHFEGYSTTESAGVRVAAMRTVETPDGPVHELVLDRTPFYAESGGQVGDIGVLHGASGPIKVLNTLSLEGRHVHIVDRLPDPDDVLNAAIDSGRRQEITKHHTATHLLHAALREGLGGHVGQRGSLVTDDRLRFDFSHFERVDPGALRAIERRVNEVIQGNVEGQVETDVPIHEARERGAMMLFGEKYGETVRVVTFDPEFSIELCGGTHVDSTGEIGLLQIQSEGSIASGVRRVEAVVGRAGLDAVEADRLELDRVKGQFKTLSRPLDQEIADLLARSRRLERDLSRARTDALVSSLDTWIASARSIDGVELVTGRADGLDMPTLRDLGESLRDRLGTSGVGLIGSAVEEEGKVYLVATVSDELIKNRGLQAGKFVGAVAKLVGGGGGGRPTLATAGGRDIAKLDHALGQAYQLLSGLME